MITLAAGESIQGVCGTASAIVADVEGAEKATSPSTTPAVYRTLGLSFLPTSAGLLYSPSGLAAMVKAVIMTNGTGSPVTGVQLFKNGTGAVNRLTQAFTLPAQSQAVFDGEHPVQVSDANGALLFTVPITLTGDVSGTGNGSVATTVIALQGRSLLATAPSTKDVIAWNGSAWAPATQDHTYISDFDTQVRTSRLDQMAAPTGPVSLNSQKLTTVASGTVSTDGINLGQLTAAIEGRKLKDPALWGTTGAITLSGLGTQGGGEWTGALTAGDRILVKNQASSATDGVYLAASGAWTRASDVDTAAEITGASVLILNGASLIGDTWSQSLTVTTLGTDPQTWAQTGEGATYLADGTSITLTGLTFSRNALTGDVTAPAGSSATTLATVNANVGSFGSATQVATFTVNAKGLTTAAGNTTIQIAESQVTGLVTDLGLKANDNAVVHLTGIESITGAKTFQLADPTITILSGAAGTNSGIIFGRTSPEVNVGVVGTAASYFSDTVAGAFAIRNVGGAIHIGTGVQTSPAELTITSGQLAIEDAANFAFGTTTGTKFGTGTTQKIGFFNATPVGQIAGSTDILAGMVTIGFRAASANPPLNIGTGTFTGGIADMATGFRIGGAAALTNYLRGDGTNFVAATVATVKSDLSLSGTNSGDQTISITGDVTASGSTGVLTATTIKLQGTPVVSTAPQLGQVLAYRSAGWTPSYALYNVDDFGADSSGASSSSLAFFNAFISTQITQSAATQVLTGANATTTATTFNITVAANSLASTGTLIAWSTLGLFKFTYTGGGTTTLVATNVAGLIGGTILSGSILGAPSTTDVGGTVLIPAARYSLLNKLFINANGIGLLGVAATINQDAGDYTLGGGSWLVGSTSAPFGDFVVDAQPLTSNFLISSVTVGATTLCNTAVAHNMANGQQVVIGGATGTGAITTLNGVFSVSGVTATSFTVAANTTGGTYTANSAVVTFGAGGLTGFSVRNLNIDCRGNALSGTGWGSGFRVVSAHAPQMDNCYVMDPVLAGYHFDCLKNGCISEYHDCTRGTLSNLRYRCVEQPAGPPSAITTSAVTNVGNLNGSSLTVTAGTNWPATGAFRVQAIDQNTGTVLEYLVSYTGGANSTTLTGCTAVPVFPNSPIGGVLGAATTALQGSAAAVPNALMFSGATVKYASANNAEGMRQHGSITANTNLMTINLLTGTYGAGTGIMLGQSDSCSFVNTVQNRSGSSGIGVDIQGATAIGGAAGAARNHTFIGGSAGQGGVRQRGSGDYGYTGLPIGNSWPMYQLGNGEPIPVVGTGTQFAWPDPNGALGPQNVGPFLTATQAFTSGLTGLINNTSTVVPPQGPQIGLCLTYELVLQKTGATGTSITFALKYGTANSAADGTISAITYTGTGAAETATLVIRWILVGPLGGSCVGAGIAYWVSRQLTTTGWVTTVAAASPTVMTPTTFNSAISNPGPAYFNLAVTANTATVFNVLPPLLVNIAHGANP